MCRDGLSTGSALLGAKIWPDSPEYVTELGRELQYRAPIHEAKLRGLTIKQLRRVEDYAEKLCPRWHDGPLGGQGTQSLAAAALTFHEVNAWLVKPSTKNMCCSFVELLMFKGQAADWFIIHCWDSKIQDLSLCCECHQRARGLPETSTFWVPPYAIRQHAKDRELGASLADSGFHRAMSAVKGALMMLHPTVNSNLGCSKPLDRAWCLLEAYLALDLRSGSGTAARAQAGARPFVLDLVSPTGSEAAVLMDGLSEAEQREERNYPGEGRRKQVRRDHGFPPAALQGGPEVRFQAAEVTGDLEHSGLLKLLESRGDSKARVGHQKLAENVNDRLRAFFAACTLRLAAGPPCDAEALPLQRALGTGCADDASLELLVPGAQAGVIAAGLPEHLRHLSLDIAPGTASDDVLLAAAAALRGTPSLRAFALHADSCDDVGVVGLRRLTESLPRSLAEFSLHFDDAGSFGSPAAEALCEALPKELQCFDLDVRAPCWAMQLPGTTCAPTGGALAPLIWSPALRRRLASMLLVFSWEAQCKPGRRFCVEAAILREEREISRRVLLAVETSSAAPSAQSETFLLDHVDNRFVAELQAGDRLVLSYRLNGADDESVSIRDLRCSLRFLAGDGRVIGASPTEPREMLLTALRSGAASGRLQLSVPRPLRLRINEDLRPICLALQANHSVVDLCLSGTVLETVGARLLAATLRENATVQRLHLERCKLGAEGCCCVAEALHENKSLRELSLKENYVAVGGARALAAALKAGANATLEFLDLAGNALDVAGARALAAALAENDGVKTLSLRGNSLRCRGAGEIAKALAANRQLTVLDVGSNAIGDDGAGSLAEALLVNRGLCELNLSDNRVSMASHAAPKLLRALAHSGTPFRRLSLENNVLEGFEAGHALAALLGGEGEEDARQHAVQCPLELRLKHNALRPEGASELARVLRWCALRILGLEGCRLGTIGGVAVACALKDNRCLLQLLLPGNGLGPEVARALAEALIENRTLEHLDLDKNYLGSRGAQDLAEALVTNRSLKSLSMSSNDLDDMGASDIAAALRDNVLSALHTLRLARNCLGYEAARAISETLLANRTLAVLDMSHNALGKEGALALSEALRDQRSFLRELHLQSTSLETQGVEALGAALETNRQLKLVDLSSNLAGASAAQALGRALQLNDALKIVLLRGMSLGSSGCEAIAAALAENVTLEVLNLSGNHVGVGVLALASALQRNRALLSLDLRQNALPGEVTEALASAASTHRRLRQIELDGNPELKVVDGCRSASATTSLASSLWRNRALTLGSRTSVLASGLPRSLTTLRLNFSNCPDVSDEDLYQLALAFGEQLRVLQLGLDGCLQISDAGVRKIAESLPAALADFRLGLVSCLKVSGEGLVAVVLHLPESLKLLSVDARCTAASAAGFAKTLDLTAATSWREALRTDSRAQCGRGVQRDHTMSKEEVIRALLRSYKVPWKPAGGRSRQGGEVLCEPSATPQGFETTARRAYFPFANAWSGSAPSENGSSGGLAAGSGSSIPWAPPPRRASTGSATSEACSRSWAPEPPKVPPPRASRPQSARGVRRGSYAKSEASSCQSFGVPMAWSSSGSASIGSFAAPRSPQRPMSASARGGSRARMR
eukprot:TRINITY_DN11121_c1_g1_i1.p1 TRINITY_DN11121_c1_g1~~TRINITY_DN11121_c1_g1_i1.p1  ORF type:complete len:1626 (-),score=357.23 TRINITY_DN11121_c1_g1_i1:65-4942(-)